MIYIYNIKYDYKNHILRKKFNTHHKDKEIQYSSYMSRNTTQLC